jgi:hypothetical protein
MEDEIINKISGSALEVFDLEDYYPAGIRTQLDISQFLLEGFLLREKEFRQALKEFNWSQFQNQYVGIYCSTDAIIPAWATILVTVYASPYAKKVVLGNLENIENALYTEILATVDFSVYQDKAVILKGCSKKPVPQSAYLLAMQQLQKFARSVMYGEACSAVPLYKKTKV